MPVNDRFYKDPLAKRKLTFDFTTKLGADVITSLQWVITGGITLESSPAPGFSGQKVTAYFSGGVIGDPVPTVTCRVNTSGGRQLDWTIDFYIQRDYTEITKDPDDVIDISPDWNVWLATEGDVTIADSAWSADAGITVTSAGISGTLTPGNMSGGTSGNYYELLNSMTASDAQIEIAAFKVFVRDN